MKPHKRLSYNDRAGLCTNHLAQQLFLLLHNKKTNLALSADVNTCTEVLALADQLGPEICVLKTHVDILTDFTLEFTQELVTLAHRHQFFIFEDRKFADIGNTVKQQYEKGIYHISDWADIINAHSLPGAGIVSGLATIGLPKQRGLLLLAEMSSSDNLFSFEYTQKTVHMAEQFPEFVLGFIAQKKLASNPHWIYMTPGVQLTEGKDSLGQHYITPQKALIENGSDIIIVGRGILQAQDRLAETKKYRQAGWNAYCEALKN
ncbi:MAG: pyrF [Gammaproteobacteria bacterium]|jgi:uridine monophosphate synthetase|nr:pyrF [Gammaproteobacteria bacterium]